MTASSRDRIKYACIDLLIMTCSAVAIAAATEALAQKPLAGGINININIRVSITGLSSDSIRFIR